MKGKRKGFLQRQDFDDRRGELGAPGWWISLEEAQSRCVGNEQWWTSQDHLRQTVPVKQHVKFAHPSNPIWLTFDGGDVYLGEWKEDGPNGCPVEHGFGIAYYHAPMKGLVYIGQWENGERHGTGHMFWLESSKTWATNSFPGNIICGPTRGRNGRRSGIPFVYTGRYQNDIADDTHAVVTLKDGTKRVGTWADGEPVGDWEEHRLLALGNAELLTSSPTKYGKRPASSQIQNQKHMSKKQKTKNADTADPSKPAAVSGQIQNQKLVSKKQKTKNSSKPAVIPWALRSASSQIQNQKHASKKQKMKNADTTDLSKPSAVARAFRSALSQCHIQNQKPVSKKQKTKNVGSRDSSKPAALSQSLRSAPSQIQNQKHVSKKEKTENADTTDLSKPAAVSRDLRSASSQCQNQNQKHACNNKKTKISDKKDSSKPAVVSPDWRSSGAINSEARKAAIKEEPMNDERSGHSGNAVLESNLEGSGEPERHHSVVLAANVKQEEAGEVVESPPGFVSVPAAAAVAAAASAQCGGNVPVSPYYVYGVDSSSGSRGGVSGIGNSSGEGVVVGADLVTFSGVAAAAGSHFSSSPPEQECRVLQIQSWLEQHVFCNNPDLKTMELYSRRLFDEGVDSIDFLQNHHQLLDIDEYEWMKPLHRKLFQKRLKELFAHGENLKFGSTGDKA